MPTFEPEEGKLNGQQNEVWDTDSFATLAILKKGLWWKIMLKGSQKINHRAQNDKGEQWKHPRTGRKVQIRPNE